MHPQAPCLVVLSLFFFLTIVNALFQDEAYRTDFQHALLGTASPGNTFFHQPSVSSKASLLYTLSERLIVGAINPKDGDLVWRQDLNNGGIERRTSLGILRAANNTNLLISSVGNRIRAWDASEGRLVWEREEKGMIQSLELLEVDPMIVSMTDSKVYLSRLNGMNGKMIWDT